MNNKGFSYPSSIRLTKLYGKVLVPLLAILTIYAWLSTNPRNYDSIIEPLIIMIIPPLFTFFVFWFIYSWSDIRVDGEGMYVEFVGRYLFVPWKKVDSIKFIGNRLTGVWLIKVGQSELTLFHRTYSLFFDHSNQPGFLIHPKIKYENELVRMIRNKIER